MVDKKTQTVELELIEPNEINHLKVKIPFKSSDLEVKVTNSDPTLLFDLCFISEII